MTPYDAIMMTSSNGNIFRVTGHLCGEFTGSRRIPPPHKGQWRGASMFSLMCIWINGWENNRDAGDFRRYRAHYDVIVMNLAYPGEMGTIYPLLYNRLRVWTRDWTIYDG